LVPQGFRVAQELKVLPDGHAQDHKGLKAYQEDPLVYKGSLVLKVLQELKVAQELKATQARRV
jgi:hypothetical protein